jgi:spermidine synthase
MVGHIPFFAGLNAEKVLVIGFGIGITTSAIASHDCVQHIDCVELAKPLFESAHFYSELNHNVQYDKRLKIISGDGRHFLQTSDEKYDLISCDPTHPVLGSGNLYSKEYFTECYEHLNRGGMVSQYLPLHKLRQEDLLGIIKTFHSVFPNSTLWLGQYHGILIGKKGDFTIDFQAWKNEVEKLSKDEYFYLDAYHIAANLIFDSKKIENLTKYHILNTDNKSYTEFFDFDCFSEENLPENFKFVSENRTSTTKTIQKMDDEELFAKYKTGNILLNKSIYRMLKNEREESYHELLQAVNQNPEDQEYRFLLKFLY